MSVSNVMVHHLQKSAEARGLRFGVVELITRVFAGSNVALSFEWAHATDQLIVKRLLITPELQVIDVPPENKREKHAATLDKLYSKGKTSLLPAPMRLLGKPKED